MKLNSTLLFTFFLLFLSCGTEHKSPYQNTKLDFESRAEDLVSQDDPGGKGRTAYPLCFRS